MQQLGHTQAGYMITISPQQWLGLTTTTHAKYHMYLSAW